MLTHHIRVWAFRGYPSWRGYSSWRGYPSWRGHPSPGPIRRFQERIAPFLLAAELFFFVWEWMGRPPVEQQRLLNVLPTFVALPLQLVIGPSADSLRGEGESLLAGGKPEALDRSIEAFGYAIRLNSSPKLYHLRGEAYKGIRDLDHAMQDYSHAIELDSGFAPAFFMRAQLKFDREDFAGAASDFQKFIALEPRNDEALMKLGDTYMAMRSEELAMTHYAKALVINSGNSRAAYNLSQAYYRKWQLGDKKPVFAVWIEPRKPTVRRPRARRLEDDGQWNHVWMRDGADNRFDCVMPIEMCLRSSPRGHNPFGCPGANHNRCRSRDLRER